MTIISIIAAIDENAGLGKNNQLLCHLPADLKHFKQTTLGKPVIMGRKTFASIGKPLPHRQNIVLTHQSLTIEGVEMAHSLQDALLCAKQSEEVMIIGGESVFAEALPIAQHIYLTIIHHKFDADVFFPQIDLNRWECLTSKGFQRDEHNQYDMTFHHYQRNFKNK